MAAAPSFSPDLSDKNVAQLRVLARQLGVRSYPRMARSELLGVLAKVLPFPASQPTPSEPEARQQPQACTQLTFLPRDPQWAYVFWTISSADRERAATAGGQQLCLRVADVTGLPPGASHPHALQELVVQADAEEWYLPVPLCDRDYRVELGYRLGGGGWLSLAMSSVARVPAEGPSPVVADAFVSFSLEGPIGAVSQLIGGSGGVEHERLYQLASAGSARSRRIGSEVLHEHDFIQDQGGLLHASGAGVWASGRNESGSGLLRQRSFWLVADAELIVYGATEPSASLFIGEEPIALQADGTFRVHVPFRDGEQLYPIRAVADDGEQERAIRLEFQRRTPEARVNTREEAQLAWF
ncbi:MAG: DUF4912 domain-containing protein [Synechococcaceae cyanobacterium]|nr:DUF4912 domain-containing protein [Synechococcaceae cyanobacterium]